MKVGEKELEKLANAIVRKLKEEFSIKHLSKNLVNTIKIEMDGSPPGPAVPGVLQARTLVWVAMSSSNA